MQDGSGLGRVGRSKVKGQIAEVNLCNLPSDL
jgi:hypothetical protein